PRIGGQRLKGQVIVAERGQDADHHHVRADAAGLLVGSVEAGPDLALEGGQAAASKLAGPDVDLDVELTQFSLEIRVGDRREDLRVAHCRLGIVVDEVELDLEAGLRTLEVET